MAIDGDSLAHRAFHALPSSIKDGAGRPANMIVGFANMLATLWDAEQPRTIVVGWDTLTTPTYRSTLLPGYQGGREFPPELTEQLDRLPVLVAALGFASAKAAGFEADDFLAAAARAETGPRRKDARRHERPRRVPACERLRDARHAESAASSRSHGLVRMR